MQCHKPIYSVVGDRYTFLLTGEETGGDYAVFDFFIPPGKGPPPHLHRREDEAFLIIDGEFEFVVAGESLRLSSGQFILAKRDIPHQFKNVGTTPGRIVCTVTPSGLEKFFAEIGTELPSREAEPIMPTEADIQKLLETAPKYGIEILPPASPVP